MNKTLLIAAMAGIVSASNTLTATAEESTSKVKCYGIAKAGKNDCKSADGTHGCANLARTDNDPNEWKFVSENECKTEGGSLEQDSLIP